jgi:hypothetical protein
MTGSFYGKAVVLTEKNLARSVLRTKLESLHRTKDLGLEPKHFRKEMKEF